MEEVVAGLDVGTSSIKLILYGTKGVIYSDRMDHSGACSNGREIDPIQLIEDIAHMMRKAKTVNKNTKIMAIGLSTLFPSFIAVDDKGMPLTKLITWMDTRGEDIVLKYKERKKESKELQEKTGCVIHESHTLWKIFWLKECKNEIFSKTAKFLSLQDYLAYKLTGKFAISNAVASTTGLFNIHTLKWDEDILKMAGISKCNLSECHEIFHKEEILNEMKQRMGLKDDVVLVLGAGDGQLSNIGSGCLTEKTMCSTIGTSAALRSIGGSERNNLAIWRYYLYDKKYITGIAINAGSSTLAWVYRNLLHKEQTNLFSAIDNLDMDKPSDIIFLPFLDGERGPNYNQKTTASLFGLSSKSTDTDILKAAIEGILFNLYDCYRLLADENNPPKEIVATGGYVHSEKMLQMQSDIFNVNIKVPYFKESSALGAAIVSLVAIGKINAISDINAVYEKTYVPNPKKHAEYMKKYEKYKKLYTAALNCEK